MNFQEYTEEASKTAFYPDKVDDFRLAYLTLKLCGETGELKQSEDKEEFLKELGDILWYLSQFCKLLNITITILPDVFCDGFESPIEWIIDYACYIAEKIGKIYRDKNGVPDKLDLSILELNIDQMLKIIIYLAYLNNATLSEIMKMNLEKLADRQKRGKLGGSGNDR